MKRAHGTAKVDELSENHGKLVVIRVVSLMGASGLS